MNRTRMALVVFALTLFTVFAAAASATPSVGTFEINAGYAKSSTEVAPLTSPTDALSGSISFGAGYFRSIAPTTSWGVEASLDNLGTTDWNTGTATATSKTTVLRVTPEVRMNFGSAVGPSFFAQGGAGLYAVTSKVETTDVLYAMDQSQSKFGFNLGAGVGIPVSPKTNLNVLGSYHSISTEGTSTNYLGLRAGIAFNL